MDLARLIATEVVPENDLRNFGKCGEELGKALCEG